MSNSDLLDGRTKDIRDKYIGLRNRYFKLVTEKNKLLRVNIELRNEIEKLEKKVKYYKPKTAGG